MKAGPFLSVFLAAAVIVPIVQAQDWHPNARILLHVTNPTTKSMCASGALTDCRYANTRGELYPRSFFTYVIVNIQTDIAGRNLAGAEFGVMYDNGAAGAATDHQGIDIFQWVTCTTAEFPTTGWPQPGSGNMVTWDLVNECQRNVNSVAGYFYMTAYQSGAFQLTQHPGAHKAAVANCMAMEQDVAAANLGSAYFSSGYTTYGYNPCCPTGCPPVAPPPFVEPPTPPPPPPPPPPPDSTVLAGDPKIILHLTNPVTRDQCINGFLDDPADAVTSGQLATGAGPFYFAYVLVAPGSVGEVAGVEFGVTYQDNQAAAQSDHTGIDIFNWVHCGASQFTTPSWPAPGSGNRVVWDRFADCQKGHTAVAGYFYVGAYSTDELKIIVHPSGKARMGTCEADEFNVDISEARIGFAAFSPGAQTSGCNPALADCSNLIPVEKTTWGALKTLYR